MRRVLESTMADRTIGYRDLLPILMAKPGEDWTRYNDLLPIHPDLLASLLEVKEAWEREQGSPFVDNPSDDGELGPPPGMRPLPRPPLPTRGRTPSRHLRQSGDGTFPSHRHSRPSPLERIPARPNRRSCPRAGTPPALFRRSCGGRNLDTLTPLQPRSPSSHTNPPLRCPRGGGIPYPHPTRPPHRERPPTPLTPLKPAKTEYHPLP